VTYGCSDVSVDVRDSYGQWIATGMTVSDDGLFWYIGELNYWDTTPWEICAACQELTTRDVICSRWSAGVVSESSFCGGSQPDTSKACNAGCAWVTGTWGPCTAYCGGASRVRSVVCPAVDSFTCGQKPADSEECDVSSDEMAAACPWIVGEWTPADEECQCGAAQSRSVFCAATGEDMCARWAQKPTDERPCGCWIPSDWDECSCDGVQARTVLCSVSFCTDPMPAMEQAAPGRSCWLNI
jgi:hypothetical protein